MLVALFPRDTLEWRTSNEDIDKISELCRSKSLNYGRVLAITGKCRIID